MILNSYQLWLHYLLRKNYVKEEHVLHVDQKWLQMNQLLKNTNIWEHYRKEVWFSLLLRHTILCFKPLAYYKISPVGFILTTIHNIIENKSDKGVDEEIQVT